MIICSQINQESNWAKSPPRPRETIIILEIIVQFSPLLLSTLFRGVRPAPVCVCVRASVCVRPGVDTLFPRWRSHHITRADALFPFKKEVSVYVVVDSRPHNSIRATFFLLVSFFVSLYTRRVAEKDFFLFSFLVIQLTETEPAMFFVRSTTLNHVPEDTLSYQLLQDKNTTAALKKTNAKS